MRTSGPGTVFFRHYLAAAATAAVVLIAVIAVASRAIFHDSIISEAEHHAVELARGLTVCELAEVTERAEADGRIEIDAEEYEEIDLELRSFLEPFAILEISLFDAGGNCVYSTGDGSEPNDRGEATRLAAALRGEVSAVFRKPGRAMDLAHRELHDLEVVETCLPLLGNGHRVLGAFALRTNVGPHLATGYTTWLRLILSAAALILTMSCVLALLVRRLCYRMNEAARLEDLRTAELARSEHFLQVVMDSIPDDLVVIDADYRVLLANRSVRDKTELGAGCDRRHCYELFHHRGEPCSGADDPCPIAEAIRTGRRAAAVHRHVDNAGRESFVEAVIVPICDAESTPVQFIEHCRDITERVRYAQDMAAANAELQSANERLVAAESEALRQARHAIVADTAKTVFLANMSHEMRTPLTAILGYADLARECIGDVDSVASRLDVVRRNGEHLLGLIEDILDLAKIEEGQMSLHITGCDVCDLIEDLRVLVAPRAAERGLEFTVTYLTPVPTMILTDPTRLKQAALNLLFNAVKFTPTGSVALTVEMVDDPQGAASSLRLAVSDTGIGIDPQLLPNLFQPFHQGDGTASRTYGGSGLGLVITQRIAEVLGGSIEVDSTPDRGSRFVLTVAVGDVAGFPRRLPGQAAAVGDAVPVQPAIDLTGLEVLYAEDGFDNQFLVKTILQRAGARVDIAENGVVALAKSAAKEYDLILMDIQMPEMDGLEATRILRSRGFDRPIVALTANALENDRRLTAAAGCDEHLTKPVNRRQLLESVQTHCRQATAG